MGVVDACMGCESMGAWNGHDYLFDFPPSLFQAASVGNGAGVYSGYIPIRYEQVDCGTGDADTNTDTNTGTSSDTSDTSSDTSSDSNTDNNSGNGSTCAAAWAQCGGQNFEGPTCCVSGYSCVASSQWYSQCKPTTDSADTNTNTNTNTNTINDPNTGSTNTNTNTDTSTDTSADANVDVNTDANTNTGTNTAGGTCAAAWAS